MQLTPTAHRTGENGGRSIVGIRVPEADSKPTEVRILLVEDDADDAELVASALRRARFRFSIVRVEEDAGFGAALSAAIPDVVLCDFHLPRFGIRRAFEIMEARGLSIPVIVVSRHITDVERVATLQRGAVDCVRKDRLAHLPAAILAALRRRG